MPADGLLCDDEDAAAPACSNAQVEEEGEGEEEDRGAGWTTTDSDCCCLRYGGLEGPASAAVACWPSDSTIWTRDSDEAEALLLLTASSYEGRVTWTPSTMMDTGWPDTPWSRLGRCGRPGELKIPPVLPWLERSWIESWKWEFRLTGWETSAWAAEVQTEPPETGSEPLSWLWMPLLIRQASPGAVWESCLGEKWNSPIVDAPKRPNPQSSPSYFVYLAPGDSWALTGCPIPHTDRWGIYNPPSECSLPHKNIPPQCRARGVHMRRGGRCIPHSRAGMEAGTLSTESKGSDECQRQ